MGRAIDRYDFVLGGVLRVIFYRSLHMVSVPFPPREVLAYALENSLNGGQFRGRVEEVRVGALVSVWMWRGIRMGDGLTMDAWFLGFNQGAQTALVRTGWYKGNFSQRSLATLVDPLGVVLTEPSP